MFCVACTEPVAPPKVAMSFKCDDETFAEWWSGRRDHRLLTWRSTKWVAPEQFDTLGAAELEKLIARAYEIVKAKLGTWTGGRRRNRRQKAEAKKGAKNPSTRAKAAKKRPSALAQGKEDGCKETCASCNASASPARSVRPCGG